MDTKELSIEEAEDRISALEKQLESEQIYRNSFEQASVGIVHTAPDGTILRANRQISEITGYGQQELIGRLYHQFTYPDDIPAEKELFSKVTEEKINTYEFEKRYIHKNGLPVWVKLFIDIVRKPDQQIGYVMSTSIVINDRKEIESELNESEYRYRQVFEGAGDAIIVTNKNAIIVDVNPAFTQITGVQRQEIIGKSSLKLARKFAKPGDFPKLFTLIKRYISDKEAMISDFTYNGKHLEIYTSTPKGKPFGIGIMRDITERNSAHNALEESEANLLSVIESTRDAIWSVDKNFRILTVNSRFKKDFDAMYGCDLRKGTKITEIVLPEESKKWIERYEKVLRGDQITEQETYRIEGKKKFFEIRMNPIRENKNITGISVISTEITDLINQQLHLNELNQQFSIAAEAAGFGIWSYNVNAQQLTWDKWMFKLYGTDPAAFSGVVDAWKNSVHPKDREPAIKALTEAITNQNKFEHEFRIRTPNGEIKYLKGYGILVKNTDSNDVIMVGINHDITRQKIAQQQLEQSNAFAHAVANSTPAMIYIWDIAQAKNIWTNNLHQKFFNEILQNTSDQNLENIAQITHQDDFEDLLQKTNELIAVNNRRVIDKEIRIRQSDQWKWMYLRVSVFEANERGIPAKLIGALFDIDEKKKAEQKLNEVTGRYKTIVANFPNGAVFLFDSNNVYIHADGSILNQFNLSPEKIKGKKVGEIFPPDLSDIIQANIANVFKGEACFYEVEYMGHIFGNWGVPIFDTDGNITEGLVYAVDITTQKQHEQTIRESKDRFSALVNNLQTGVIYINTKGEIIEINPAMLDILGSQSLEESKKINVLEFEPLKKVGYAQNLKKCIEKGESVMGETEYLTTWGKNIIVNYYMVPIKENHKVVGVLSANEDVTEKRKAAEQLVFQSRLLDNINDYITVTDLKGNIIYINQTVRRNFDVEPHKSSIHDFGEDPNTGVTQQRIIDETLKNGTWRCEVVNLTKDNKKMILDARTQLLRDQNGKPYGILGLSSDITLRKKYEKDLETKNRELIAQNEEYQAINEELDESLKRIRETTQKLETAKERAEAADRLKSAFLANMSHEIRTPMNGILGFADLLKEPDISGDEKEHFIDIIEMSGKRMLNIINDLIDISKIESGQMEVSIRKTNISEQAGFLYTFFKPEAKKKGLTLICNLPDESSAGFHTDREKVYAVISNLIKNAIKYTSQGTIEFGFDFSNSTDQRILHVYVKDTGIGIPQNRINAIFDRFVQADIEDTKALEGAGLGLAISKAYAEMLGGTITVESTEGKGSTFHFYTPDHSGDAVAKAIEENPEEIATMKPGPHLKILIAEDDETSRMHLSILLQDSATELIAVDAGDKAVEMCRRHPDIDLVMMDIKLPGMQGYDATRKIREFNKEVIIIAQTAYALSGDREKALESGCNDYIAKPIKKDVLLNLIQKYF